MKHPVFVSCAILFGMHQLLEKGLGAYIPLINSYLDALLCFPILLTLVLEERRHFQSVPQLTLFEIVVITIGLAVIFEEGFPRWSSQFTKDPLDYFAYAIGSTLFAMTINRNEQIAAPP